MATNQITNLIETKIKTCRRFRLSVWIGSS